MIAAAQHIAGRPYIYGGGHGSWESAGYDCSGAVSYILHAAGLLGSPMDTTALANWGQPGGGKYVTVGVRGGAGMSGHTMMSFFGKFFESGGSGGGPHWDSGWDGYFPISRHPPGLAQGGMVGDFGEVSPAMLLKYAPFLKNDPKFLAYQRQYKGRALGGLLSGFATGGVPISGPVKDSKTGKVIPPVFVGKPKTQPTSSKPVAGQAVLPEVRRCRPATAEEDVQADPRGKAQVAGRHVRHQRPTPIRPE